MMSMMDLSSSEHFSSMDSLIDVDNDQQIQKINPNYLKNILRSYFHYLTDKQNQETVNEMISNKKSYSATINVIKKYIKKYKFNNDYLGRLLKNKGYRRTFEYYLTFDIFEWLCTSKVDNRDAHIKCIESLKDICVNLDQME